MAELRKARRGEIGRQHVTEHYVAASVYVWFHLSHPDQKQHKSDKPRHWRLGTLLFSTNVTGSLTYPKKLIRKGYNVNAQWRDHLDWERVLITATMRDKSVETLLSNIQIPCLCVPPPLSPKSMLYFRPSSLPVLKQYNVDFGGEGLGDLRRLNRMKW